MAKAKKISENYYGEFEKYKAEYFERKKSEYLFAVQIATIKNAGHHVFERKEMKSESARLQKELGLYARLIIDIEHEMEIDSRIVMKDRFNQKILEIAIDKRLAVIKGIGEYEGLRELYTFWQHKADYIKIIDDPFSQPIEVLIYLEKDFADSFKTVITEREKNFTESLSMRASNNEKINFIEKEITVQRALIECDLLYKYFAFLNQHPERFGGLIAHNWKNFHHVSTVLFGDKTEEGEEATNILLEYVFQREKEISKDEISDLIKSLKEKGIESKALYNLLRSQYKELEHRLFYITLYFHYEKEYLNFLIETYKELTQPPKSDNISSVANFEKFEWLGTQKQLVELFIELQRKGWIPEINTDAVQACFNNTDAIKQYAKPHFDTKQNKPLYSEVYTKTYKPNFKQIAQNIPKKK